MKHRLTSLTHRECGCVCTSFWVFAIFGCSQNSVGTGKMPKRASFTHSHSIEMQFSTHSRKYCTFIRLFVVVARVSLRYRIGRRKLLWEWGCLVWVMHMVWPNEREKSNRLGRKKSIHCSPLCSTWSLIAISFHLFFSLVGILLVRLYCIELRWFALIICRMMGSRQWTRAGQSEQRWKWLKKGYYLARKGDYFNECYNIGRLCTATAYCIISLLFFVWVARYKANTRSQPRRRPCERQTMEKIDAYFGWNRNDKMNFGRLSEINFSL